MRSNSNIYIYIFCYSVLCLEKNNSSTFLFSYFKQVLGMEVDWNYSGSVVFGGRFY
jgi:hypothetical protein